jgi:Uma2 family endonuclease
LVETFPRHAESADRKPHPGRRMTEREFLEWADEDTFAEWVDGEVVMMAPANIDHDQFFGWLRTVVSLFVEQHELGRVFGSEVLVRLPRQRRLRQPDLLFVSQAREGMVGATRILGAPDLIMEVVSPDSVARDWREKYLDYEKAGVGEYWVIDRLGGRMEAYALSRARKFVRIRDEQGRVKSSVLKGFHLRTEWALGATLPKLGPVLRELGVRI